MTETMRETKRKSAAGWFLLCPARHVLLLLSALFVGAYFLLRSNRALMSAASEGFARPVHRFMGQLCSAFEFSAAEGLYAALVFGLLAFLVVFIIQMIRRPQRAARAYRFVITLIMLAALIYAGMCWLWGVYYYTADFEEESGISSAPVSAEKLAEVTEYFAQLANEYAPMVKRDSDGLFAEDRQGILDKSVTLYREVVEEYPCLAGPELRCKGIICSKVMSYTNFTGFFFPFTGEANVNMDFPAALLPSTVAHELAHQRGVAAEDECNFVAVLASLENGDPAYCYSACLLAYIHLGNALYKADNAAWKELSASLCDFVRADLAANNQYWDSFDTQIAKASETVYTGFLESYGQELGLQTYGACVDLLVAYYGSDS